MSSDQGSVNQGKIGVRYSRAFLNSLLGLSGLSLSNAGGLKTRSDLLLSIADAFKVDRDAIFFLQNPMIDIAKKRELVVQHVENVLNVHGVTDAAVRQDLLNFLSVVFNNGRISGIFEIARYFQEAVQEVLGVVPVRVYVARELPQSEKEFITGKLRDYVSAGFSAGANSAASPISGASPAVECSWHIDPSLLGGYVVEFAGRGDLAGKRIDASLQGRLSTISNSLLM